MTAKETRVTLDSLLDHLELEKLINMYQWRADEFDWAGWSECFTEDAVFDMPNYQGLLTGRKQIHDVCKASMDLACKVMQHLIVNVDFELTGKDTATGRANLIFIGLPDPDQQTQSYQSGGRYHWKFRRTTDGWRICRGRLDFLWNNGKDEESLLSPHR